VCFSAQADLLGGIVVGGIGVDVVRHVDRRKDQLMLAALPLLFAAHQLDEAFVWWGLQGHVGSGVGRVAMWIYLLFAFCVLPIFVPTAVWALEPPGRRRVAMIPFIGLGVVVSGLLLRAMVRGPVTAKLAHYHLRYGIGLRSGGVIVAAYVVATCGPSCFPGIGTSPSSAWSTSPRSLSSLVWRSTGSPPYGAVGRRSPAVRSLFTFASEDLARHWRTP